MEERRKNEMAERKKIGLLTQISIAFVLAILVGVIFGAKAEVVQPLGDFFLRLIKFIIVPLILSSLIAGSASLGDVKSLGRLGGKTVSYYIITTLLAVLIGLGFGFLFSPGKGLDVSAISGDIPEANETDGIIQILLNIIPTNPMAALTNAEFLQIIFFAIFIGIGITLVVEKAQPVLNFFNGLAEVMYKITGIIMKLVPYGVFGLLAPIVGEYGLAILLPLMKLILAVALGCILHMVVVYSISVKKLGNMNPIDFFKGIMPATIVAFSTQSSAGTLPVTIKRTEDQLKVSPKVTSFVLPLGATVNMDGTSLYLSIGAIFTAQLFGIDLGFIDILLLIVIATLGSIGAAGVPGAGLVIMTFLLTALNLPLAGLALIASVDRVLDMFRTATNITGDASAALYVDRSERKHHHMEPLSEEA